MIMLRSPKGKPVADLGGRSVEGGKDGFADHCCLLLPDELLCSRSLWY